MSSTYLDLQKTEKIAHVRIKTQNIKGRNTEPFSQQIASIGSSV